MTAEPISSPQSDPYLRIKADKVSRLLDIIGELGLSALGVIHHPSINGLELEGFELASHQLERLIYETQDIVSSLRLVPLANVFHRMERVGRDLAHQTGKKFEMVLEGEDVEIDKTVVDKLADPLMHLIRNSADHALELPKERTALGKPERGKIVLKAVQHGRDVLISISDDGRGLNREAILKRARERGLIHPDAEPSDQEVWNCIFHSGFSTVKEITNLSGRGVGMDVVQNTIRSLHGRIEVDTHAGQGTQITLVIPLSLAFLDSMIVRSHDYLFAIAIDSVKEVFQLQFESIINDSASGKRMVMRQNKSVPLIDIGDGDSDSLSGTKIVVVTQTIQGDVGLLIDEVVDQQQVMMKPLSGHLNHIRGGVGCALLASGEVAIALDLDQLFNQETRDNNQT